MSDGLSIPAEALADPVMLVAVDGRILEANRAANDRFGLDIGPPGDRWLPDLTADGRQALDYLRRCARVGNPLPGNLYFQTRNGEIAYRCDGGRHARVTADGVPTVWLRLRPREKTTNSFRILSDKVGRLAHEVAERRRAELRLQALLEDKELLIRELHHRIRNTLQVLASLSNIQARAAADTATQQPLIRQVQRINAVGLAFRTLYREGHLAEVDIRSFARTLCAELATAQGRNVAVEVDFEVERLDLDAAVPFSLLLNELVSEVVARVADKEGWIQVALRRLSADEFDLTLIHSGSVESDRLLQSSRIIEILVRQLDGRLDIGGRRLHLVFRRQDPQKFIEDQRAHG